MGQGEEMFMVLLKKGRENHRSDSGCVSAYKWQADGLPRVFVASWV